MRPVIGHSAKEGPRSMIHGPEHDEGLDTEIQEIKKSPPVS